MLADNRIVRQRWMVSGVSRVFGDAEMLEQSVLLVLTRGQMRGLRATIKRLGMVEALQ